MPAALSSSRHARHSGMIESVSVHGFGRFSEIGAPVVSCVIVAVQSESTISEVGEQLLGNQAQGTRPAWPHCSRSSKRVRICRSRPRGPAVYIGEYHPAAIGATRHITQHRVDCISRQVVCNTFPDEDRRRMFRGLAAAYRKARLKTLVL